MTADYDTCDHCQKVRPVELTDYGNLCEPCFNQAEYDARTCS